MAMTAAEKGNDAARRKTDADQQPLLLKAGNAARLLDCSRSTIYALIARGELRVVRVGNLLRVPLSEIRRLGGSATDSE